MTAASLHRDELPVDETVVRALLAEQRPEWAGLPLARAGAGTDNTMFRLGDALIVRLPRTAGHEQAVLKEQAWLPRLAPRLTVCRVPEPVHTGTPGAGFPLAWSVYRWIEGAEPGPGTVRDWAAFGADLAAWVRELHAIDLMGASRAGDLAWYRGGVPGECAGWVGEAFAQCRAAAAEEGAGGPGARDGELDAGELDAGEVAALEGMWHAALALPEPSGPHGWLHGDLRPGNLLVRSGRLHAVIDFGGLSVGYPDAEHAAVWDLPGEARSAYRNALDIGEPTWTRARAWAIAIGVSGVAYYRRSWPEFAAQCRARLRAVLADAGGVG